MEKTFSCKDAFTMIELSIVITIIGLIIGAIILGKDLIQAANIRSQLSQFEKYDIAIRNFKFKYGGIPGDLADATSLGLYTHGGDGNDILTDNGGRTPICNLLGEAYPFFIQLFQTGLINDGHQTVEGSAATVHYCDFSNDSPGTGEYPFPVAKIGNGGIFAFTQADGNLAYFWGIDIPTAETGMPLYCVIRNRSTAGVVSPVDAYAVDVKRDDGLPTTGHLRIGRLCINPFDPWYKYPCHNTIAGGNCADVASNSYNLTNSDNDCRLIIDVQ